MQGQVSWTWWPLASSHGDRDLQDSPRICFDTGERWAGANNTALHLQPFGSAALLWQPHVMLTQNNPLSSLRVVVFFFGLTE